MKSAIQWLESTIGNIPLPLLEVWGRLSYLLGFALAIFAFTGFTFRLGERWALGRERQAWDAKALLCVPLTFVLIAFSGYVGSFIVLVPGAQTFESLKDLVVFVCIVLFGYPALVTVPFAYGLSDLIEGVPPDFLLGWLPGYFINPACFWLAYQLIGKAPDFKKAATWKRYLLFVVLFMALEPVLWGFICSDRFTPQISFRSISSALFFTTAITWVIAPFAMLGALPLARSLGLFWAEIPGHVKERGLLRRDGSWEAGGRATLARAPQGLPIRMFILLPFIALVLVMVGTTAYTTLRSAEHDAQKLAIRLHQEISENINLKLDDYLAREPRGSSADVTRMLTNLPISKEGRALIVDRAGNRIAGSSSPDSIDETAVAALRAELGDLQKLGDSAELSFDNLTIKPLSRETWLAYATSYRDHTGGHGDWIVMTIMPEAYYLAGVREGNSRSALVFALALLLSLVLAAWLAAKVTKPLSDISRAARVLAEGNNSIPVPSSRLEELGMLTQSFNDMTQRLRGSLDELRSEVATRREVEAEREQILNDLRKHQENLETLVRERTAALIQAKEVAERASRAKGTFLATMSHEIRTPMNAILGFGQLMQRQSDLSPRDRERLDKLMRSSYHLLELINNVLEMSKIEAGHGELSREGFDLHAAIADVESMVRERIEQKGLSFTIEGRDSLPRYVRSDVAKLRQILLNLLGNAAKFTETGGVTLGASFRPLGSPVLLRFTVTDTGVGIAFEELDHVFEPFRQTQSGLRSQTGTGLGLAISRDFARLMGGDLRIESELGRGTTFVLEVVVELSVPTEANRSVFPHGVALALAPGQPNPTILIVDDQEDNRMVLRELLQSVGVRTEEAVNGKDALRLVALSKPALIFMDLKMPEIDGVEATRRIRERQDSKDVPIVILSASVLNEGKSDVLATGANEFIAKPFREDEIWAALERHLGLLFVRSDGEPIPKSEKIMLSREQVLALGDDILKALREALELGYVGRIPAILRNLGGEHSYTVAALSELANALEIERLRKLL